MTRYGFGPVWLISTYDLTILTIHCDIFWLAVFLACPAIKFIVTKTYIRIHVELQCPSSEHKLAKNMKEHILHDLNDFEIVMGWKDMFTKHLHKYTARVCMDTTRFLQKNAGRQSFEIRRADKGLGGRGPSLEGFCAWLFTVRQEQAAGVASQQFHTVSRKSHWTIHFTRGSSRECRTETSAPGEPRGKAVSRNKRNQMLGLCSSIGSIG